MSKTSKLARIQGKWAYVWTVRNIFSGNVQKIVTACQDAGMAGVAIKIHNGTFAWDEEWLQVSELVDAINEAGLGLMLWGYNYLKYNPAREAAVAIRQIERYEEHALAYLIDAESEAKQASSAQAKLFMDPLRLYTSAIGLPIALNTYRFPTVHRELPWRELRKGTDFDCPQVYYRYTDPVSNVERSMQEYAALDAPALPFKPAGDMYREHGRQPYPGAVTEFLTWCRDRPDVSSAIMWAMDQIEAPTELWDEFAKFDWPTDFVSPPDPPDPPSPQGALFKRVVKARVLNVRSGPGTNYLVVRQVRKGAPISMYDVAGCWGMIGADEWVHMEYVE